MKIEFVQRGNRYFLRKYLLGVIPVYFNDGYDSGWQFTRSYISEERCIELLSCRKHHRLEQEQFKAAKETILATDP